MYLQGTPKSSATTQAIPQDSSQNVPPINSILGQLMRYLRVRLDHKEAPREYNRIITCSPTYL